MQQHPSEPPDWQQQPYQQPHPPAAYGNPYVTYPEASQATTVLILGILGLVLCGILSPFAWAMGNKEVQAIDAGRRPPQDRGSANAGRILGIVGTALLGLAVVMIVAYIVLIAIVLGSAAAGS